MYYRPAIFLVPFFLVQTYLCFVYFQLIGGQSEGQAGGSAAGAAAKER